MAPVAPMAGLCLGGKSGDREERQRDRAQACRKGQHRNPIDPGHLTRKCRLWFTASAMVVPSSVAAKTRPAAALDTQSRSDRGELVALAGGVERTRGHLKHVPFLCNRDML